MAASKLSKVLALEVPEGKIVTLIGANGAGKSTLVAQHYRPG
jgi:ABC-type cobalamin/Fe3+-siderophores transport system ATPase subunit